MQRRDMFIGGITGAVLSHPSDSARAIPTATPDAPAAQALLQLKMALGVSWPDRLSAVMTPDEREQMCAANTHSKA